MIEYCIVSVTMVIHVLWCFSLIACSLYSHPIFSYGNSLLLTPLVSLWIDIHTRTRSLIQQSQVRYIKYSVFEIWLESIHAKILLNLFIRIHLRMLLVYLTIGPMILVMIGQIQDIGWWGVGSFC